MATVVYTLYSTAIAASANAASAVIVRAGRIKQILMATSTQTSAANPGATLLGVQYNATGANYNATNDAPRNVVLGWLNSNQSGVLAGDWSNSQNVVLALDLPVQVGDTVSLALSFVGTVPLAASHRCLIYVEER